MTLAEAKKERQRLQKALNDTTASLEGLSQARKRAHALVQRLEKGKPSAGEKVLVTELQQDIKAFSRRIGAARAKRKKQDTRLRRIKKWIARHRPRKTVTIFDDVNVLLIPRDEKYAAAGYVNGLYTTWPEIQKGPWKHKLSIAVTTSADADCLDVEPGDATPDQAPAWISRQKADRPVIYCSVSQAATVLSVLSQHGIKREHIRLWTAHYDQHEHICSPACGFGMPTTADATQWTDHALGRSLDQSLCNAKFF